MTQKIEVREYQPKDAQALAEIYYNTIHQINIRDYSKEQIAVWAPKKSLEGKRWQEKFSRTKPLVAISNDVTVGFVELEPDGHIDCFYCHHDWIGRGVGSTLMKAIHERASANKIERLYSEVSITAKPFFEKQGFSIVTQQTVALEGIELTNFKMEKQLGVKL